MTLKDLFSKRHKKDRIAVFYISEDFQDRLVSAIIELVEG